MNMKRHKALNSKSKEILETSSIQVVCKLGEILAERGINQSDFSHLTGLRQATINDIVHDSKYTINKEHLMIIMLTLKLTCITQVYEVVFTDKKEEDQLKNEFVALDGIGLTAQQEIILSEHKNAKKV